MIVVTRSIDSQWFRHFTKANAVHHVITLHDVERRIPVEWGTISYSRAVMNQGPRKEINTDDFFAMVKWFNVERK